MIGPGGPLALRFGLTQFGKVTLVSRSENWVVRESASEPANNRLISSNMNERMPGASDGSSTAHRSGAHRHGALIRLIEGWSHARIGPDSTHRPSTWTGR